jgi:outer membrane protein W
VTLLSGNGYAGNLGVGAKYYLSDHFFVDFDVRYRYLSRLINHYGQSMNTGETTLSLGYQF